MKIWKRGQVSNAIRNFNHDSASVGFLSFGVQGALVSGKVAAMTVMDHQKGVEEFRKINRAYNAGLLVTKLHRKTPMPLLKRATWAGMNRRV